MSKVIVDLSMSLDGFIAGANDDVSELHAWLFNGATEVALPNNEMAFKSDPISADVLRETFTLYGANVTGRRTFDLSDAWGGKDPFGLPSFIVSHTVPDEWSKPDSPFTFVTEGIESAITKAKAAAGNRAVGVGAASLAQQCINLGLLDEMILHVVPVVLGEGIRLFDDMKVKPVKFEHIRVVQAPTVTHMYLRVIK